MKGLYRETCVEEASLVGDVAAKSPRRRSKIVAEETPRAHPRPLADCQTAEKSKLPASMIVQITQRCG